MERPSVQVAVVLEREARPNAWEDWRFRIVEVVEQQEAFGTEPRLLFDDDKCSRWMFPAHTVELFRDEGEGYYLNLTSGQPVWFVMWRVDEADPSRAAVEAITLSYNEAGRWLDAQERVDNVPLQPHLVAWLEAYTAQHYKPEPKRRQRPASFLSPDERGRR
ncbi:DUF3305 domain-containing protein [Caldimonas aquatica]|uniref:DUF3305 domain-containing protein n=1 Tax=Caldimonas aquatica TaxID=376175 RepID=A0ABY6MVD3_9BURK|nr:DUF3305 domain-containing protein [Schlegelella aquatica]UZD55954.1 DUF3305 domain-containing protein [Schlegelella aquatica]